MLAVEFFFFFFLFYRLSKKKFEIRVKWYTVTKHATTNHTVESSV